MTNTPTPEGVALRRATQTILRRLAEDEDAANEAWRGAPIDARERIQALLDVLEAAGFVRPEFRGQHGAIIHYGMTIAGRRALDATPLPPAAEVAGTRSVSYGAAKAIWDVSVERGLNLSRADVLALLQAAEPVILAEHKEFRPASASVRMSPFGIANEAIGLFLEYRQVHGYSVDDARSMAALGIAEGAAVTDGDLAAIPGPPSPPRPGTTAYLVLHTLSVDEVAGNRVLRLADETTPGGDVVRQALAWLQAGGYIADSGPPRMLDVPWYKVTQPGRAVLAAPPEPTS